ncbi:hypothetical protein OC25_03930 [Pedobacter kyungheensis]|uniref:Uncharacterized protein n=1 Tax=Pedobacter kyungheensis TaxID=1069985 RepID=A0A0C1DQ80_9SPHI|nr:hypothetical protein [Pedobacter kyungheensis]KIA96235.1 hypothetical protein OC25_03930 [Pedobacter kyungheensis]
MKILVTLLLLTITVSLKAQKDTSLIKDWKSHAFPVDNDTLLSYNHSSDYRVYVQNNQVKAAKGIYGKKNDLPFRIEAQAPKEVREFYSPFTGVRTTFRVDDGYLVGFNNGEFGGSLNWFSTDGKVHYLIGRFNLQQFISRDGKVYAIQGLSHMSTNEGTILQIEKKAGKWTARDYLRLPSAPRAITIDRKNRFLIATASALLRIDEKSGIESLYENDNWLYYLSPNSVVCHNAVVYVGMRGGVFRYDPDTKKQEWLRPDH